MIPDTSSIKQLSDLLADQSLPSERETEPSVPSDTVFSILSHRHRRYALSYLLERTEPVAVEAIISYVADRIGSSEDAYDQVALRFHHGHFPKLVDAGLIEYDREEEIVAPTDAAAAIEPHLQLASA